MSNDENREVHQLGRPGQSLAPLLVGSDGWQPRPVILDEFEVDSATGRLGGRIEIVDVRWGASLEIGPKLDSLGRWSLAFESAVDWPHSSARAHLSGKSAGLIRVSPADERIDDWGEFLAGDGSNTELETLRHTPVDMSNGHPLARNSVA